MQQQLALIDTVQEKKEYQPGNRINLSFSTVQAAQKNMTKGQRQERKEKAISIGQMHDEDLIEEARQVLAE